MKLDIKALLALRDDYIRVTTELKVLKLELADAKRVVDPLRDEVHCKVHPKARVFKYSCGCLRV